MFLRNLGSHLCHSSFLLAERTLQRQQYVVQEHLKTSRRDCKGLPYFPFTSSWPILWSFEFLSKLFGKIV